MSSTQPVSLWLGNFGSKKDLVQYMQIQYTEHGDSIASPFEKGFELCSYDRDLTEKYWAGNHPLPLEKLLAGCSYEDQLLPKFLQFSVTEQYNAYLLIFDYEYGGSVPSHQYRDNTMVYIGSVECTPDDVS